MPTPITVTLEWLHIDRKNPDYNYASSNYAETILNETYDRIIIMGAALPSLPDDITVTNQRIELDRSDGEYGYGQIKQLLRGMSKTGSTGNMLNIHTDKHWYSGGLFDKAIDLTNIFWSGGFSSDNPRVCSGNANLKSYIEGKGQSGWVLFGIITTQPNYYIYTNGARLKFDYT
ncbi:MAG TPA: hypothetical protein VMX56_06160, partial [Anaerolineales bacterium]|nr:hypothetical protein [Anaerolineales bacterium]